MAIPVARPGAAALVTGASSGIGAALASELAARGHDLVLVARRRDRLAELADEVQDRFGCRAHVLTADLANADERARLMADVDAIGLEVSVLVLSAGFGIVGPYLDADPSRVDLMVRTNVEATLSLAARLAPPMAARGAGAILVVSSMAGNQPMPGFAAYAATKAAVTSFGEALHQELKRSGVTVTVLAPGHVDTEFAAAADAGHLEAKQPAFLTATAEECARAAIRALEKGRRRVVPLASVRLFVWLAERIPHRIWLPMSQRMMS